MATDQTTIPECWIDGAPAHCEALKALPDTEFCRGGPRGVDVPCPPRCSPAVYGQAIDYPPCGDHHIDEPVVMVGTAVPSVPSPVTHTSQSLPSTGFDASALMLLAAVTVGAGVLGGAIAAGPKAIWARIKRESREIV